MGTLRTLLIAFGLALLLFPLLVNGGKASAQAGQSPNPAPSNSGGQEAGAQTFAANCAACHQQSGEGIVGAFPPLAGHLPKVLERPMGRDYLPRVVLFGLQGPIQAEANEYDGVMPSWEVQLSDGEVAAVLNYALTAWGNDKLLPANFKPFHSAEVAAARAEKLSTGQVRFLREKVMPKGSASAASSSKAVMFTAGQAERGRTTYVQNCQDCHGAGLDDGEYCPALKGSVFLDKWSKGSLAPLYAWIRSNMPLDKPGQLSDASYADVTAFLLSQNGYAAGGEEMPADPKLQEKMSLRK